MANYDLGLLYLNGYGVDKDPAQAAEWLEKAASLKVVDAQYAIARLYRFGTGVPQDLAKARSWYMQAAAAGHSRDEELDLLCTHGILHLLGYDHADADEEREMFALQARLLGGWQRSVGRPVVAAPAIPGAAPSSANGGPGPRSA